MAEARHSSSGIDLMVDAVDLQQKLSALSAQELKQIYTQTIRSVTVPLRRAVKSATPVGPTGNLKRSITSVVRYYGEFHIAMGFVGPNWWNRGRHGHIVELGTKKRYTKTGENRGMTTARPFIGPVFAANEAALQNAIAENLRVKLNAWWSR
jgi:hypothetical protein